jgi:hypothetical protein
VRFPIAQYQDTSIFDALKSLTRPEPGNEWERRIQGMPVPAKPKRTPKEDGRRLNASAIKLTARRSWKDGSLVKLAAGLYLLEVLTPAYVHHYAPEHKASAATDRPSPSATSTTELTSASPKSEPR